MDTFGYGIRTKFGAWNVRSLYGEGRDEQLEREMLRLKISILGISETKCRGRAEYRSDTGQTRMLYSGEDERENGQRLHGVGIMLNEVARRSLIAWPPISERIMTCYAPANEATEEDKSTFYTHLTSAYSSVPKADIIIVMGDLNAQVGADNELWEKMARVHVMKMVTCFYGDTENQIGHIMIQQQWKKSMFHVRNIRNADLGSDHHLVVISLKLKTAAVLRQSQNAARNQKFITNALSDPNISRKDTIGIN
ncbi:craniofacial development protein 2-like [Eupeodes corollae]|uniref:craniofacial development protein 2-like n=1 Tax=Eupeodes corollae TaxID=290404 RepID=UPI002490BB0C|nr:craniofacial development protein 2-like [Eupeodes corollae]